MMTSKIMMAAGAAMLVAFPAQAQQAHDHSANEQRQAGPQDGEMPMGRQEMMAHCRKMMAEKHPMMGDKGHGAAMKEGAMQTLRAYRDALVALDADAMTPLFAENSRVFENGKDEGTFANYLAHHIGPELGHLESFTFADPTMEVDVMGHVALGRETYRYDIVLKDGRRVARDGVATSVLVHGADGWKIVRYHNSSRPVRDQ